MFFNKKRTNSTFLQYKNGKVISVDDDGADSNINNASDTNQNGGISINESTNTNSDIEKTSNCNPTPLNKPKILMVIGMIMIIIPLIILSSKVFLKNINKSSNDTTTETNTLVSENSKENSKDNNKSLDNSDVNTKTTNDNIDDAPKINGFLSMIGQMPKKTEGDKSENDTSIKNNENQTESIKQNINSQTEYYLIIDSVSPESISNYSNNINYNITKHYSELKKYLLLFSGYKFSSYETVSQIKKMHQSVLSEYNLLIQNENKFITENEENIYSTTLHRYNNLLEMLNELESDLNRNAYDSIFNKGLNIDNEYCALQQNAVTKYLDSNKANYELDNNMFLLK